LERSLTLVLGGARSGKSALAERIVQAHGGAHVYIATAQAFDREMEARIAAHKVGRVDGWKTVEAPLELADALLDVSAQEVVLVDCMTLWLSNVMLAEQDEEIALEAVLETLKGHVVLVSNELGMGLVPETPLGRAFRDAHGRMNQRLAQVVDNVVFVAAGLPLVLKGEMPKGAI